MSVKAAGAGHFQIPTAPAALTSVAQSGSANTLGSAVSFGNSPSALYITGVTIGAATTQVPTYVQIQILVAASAVASVLVPYGVSAGAAASVLTGHRPIFPPIPVANGAAITVKSASSVASAVGWGVSLECIAQSNVVDDAIPVTTVTTVTSQLTAAQIATGVWTDTTAGDFTTALSVGKSVMNGVSLGTGLTVAAVSGAVGSVTGAVGSVTGAVGSIASGGIARAAFAADTGLLTARSNTAAAGGATSITLDASASAVDSFYVGAVVALTGGTGAGQGRVITAYVGSTKVATVDRAWVTNPDATSTFAVLVFDEPKVDSSLQVVSSSVQGSVTGSVASVSGAVGSVTGLTASNLDAAISSRMASYTQPSGFLAATFPSSVASPTNITAGTITTVTNLTNLPAITAGWLTATGIAANALNGKGDWLLSSGYTAPSNLTAAQIATGVWQDTTAGDFTVAASIGKSVMNGVALGTGLTVARCTLTDTATNLTNAPTAGDLTSTMKTSVTTAATAATPTAAAVTAAVTVGTNNDKTGYALSLAGVQAVWDALTSALTTVGSIGKRISDYLTGDSYARIGAAGAGLTALGDTRLANLDAAISTRSTYAGGDTSGTTTLLSRLTGTRATNLDNLDAAVTTRLASASYTAPDNAGIAAIPTATQNADALLNRDMSAVSDTTARSPLNALRFLRNRWDVSGTALSVKKEDDVTEAWSAVVTAAPGADPISGADPA